MREEIEVCGGRESVRGNPTITLEKERLEKKGALGGLKGEESWVLPPCKRTWSKTRRTAKSARTLLLLEISNRLKGKKGEKGIPLERSEKEALTQNARQGR